MSAALEIIVKTSLLVGTALAVCVVLRDAVGLTRATVERGLVPVNGGHDAPPGQMGSPSRIGSRIRI